MGKKFDLTSGIGGIWKIIKYLVFGVLTTAVNFLTYSLCLMAGIDYMLGNLAAFAVSVSFAYFTNRRWVFGDPNVRKPNLPESVRFIGCRILTLVLESIILYIFINKMSLNKYAVKAAANIFVVVGNYALSEFVVFQKDKSGDKGYYE